MGMKTQVKVSNHRTYIKSGKISTTDLLEAKKTRTVNKGNPLQQAPYRHLNHAGENTNNYHEQHN